MRAQEGREKNEMQQGCVCEIREDDNLWNENVCGKGMQDCVMLEAMQNVAE